VLVVLTTGDGGVTERIALADDYFIRHKLYPNAGFYSGIIYQATGFPVAMFPVLFAIGRMPGWLAQWQEGTTDPEERISRPGSPSGRRFGVRAAPAAELPFPDSVVSWC